MATNSLPRESEPLASPDERLQAAPERSLPSVLAPFASLKLTVTLFALAIFLVFAGTIAQTEMDIWEVIEQYFRTPVAWINVQIFSQPLFFTGHIQLPDVSFPFPGGWLIGLLMFVNLLAAHAVRFKAQARGTRLAMGLGVIGFGLVLTALVVLGGSDKVNEAGVGALSWTTLWAWIKAALAGLWLMVAYGLATLDRSRKVEWWSLVGVAVALGGLLAWLLISEDVYPGGPAMRILWQLIKGGLAGLVLLGGCVIVFKKRAGIVLLHSGVGLLMFSELWTGLTAVETQMRIKEGETVNFVEDIRETELAVVDRMDPDHVVTVAVPQSILEAAAESGEKISHKNLPFDVKVVKYLKNSTLRRVEDGNAKDAENNPATAGAGKSYIAEKARAAAGTDTGGEVDVAAAYVQFLDQESGRPLGTHLLSLVFAMEDHAEHVTAGKTTYDTYLRFKRTYKDYSVRLDDVRADMYLGTTTPKNYSSDIQLVDRSRNVERKVHIWMNNPLRYAGETFYQSGYLRDPATGMEQTTLQVVANRGWMIPYVSCMIVAIGLLAHFSITLLRFVSRRARGRESGEPVAKKPKSRRLQNAIEGNAWDRWFPWVTVGVFALWLVGQMRPPGMPSGEMDLTAFGKLPVVYQGRIKPFDTLARNSLRIVSGKEEFTDDSGEKRPAIRWLLDVMSGSDAARKHPVVKIDNLEVLDLLSLERRSRYRYAIDDFADQIDKLEKQAELASKVDSLNRSVYENKVLELARKLRLHLALQESHNFLGGPTKDPMQQFQLLLALPKHNDRLKNQFALPHSIPPTGEQAEWTPYSEAATAAWVKELTRQHGASSADQLAQKLGRELTAQMAQAEGREPPADVPPGVLGGIKQTLLAAAGDQDLGAPINPAFLSLRTILDAYGRGDAPGFNEAVSDYQTYLGENEPGELKVAKTSFESFFNHFSPFYHAAVVYFVAFVLGAIGWLGWTRPLNRAAFGLVLLALVVHTFALVARIYISGRPPVTNLYSSAVFIGWGCVVLAIVLERIYRLGIGTTVASVLGFITLVIAHNLSGDGDTFEVLQAVLDTQFWLATHVTCITLGYATTFLAGMLGVIYVLRGVLTPSLSEDVSSDLSRMIYGIVCFATFFSFVGTVLGGLWADDSWGRFWGWDPKENGALIIVLWNVLILHARWGKMVGPRGLAVLAIVGNIVTTWSWFGVNELGVGLHSYGFTEGTRRWLSIAIAAHLAIIGLGLVPKDNWLSFRGRLPSKP